MDLDLDAVESRVLGALMEKEVTVPATYPLTLNSLVTACNQSSSRDPIMHVTGTEAEAAIDRLKSLGLARMVHAGSGARVVKYRQVAHETLALDPAERSVVTLLLLRGPQTPGELRSRGDRLGHIDSLAEVEAALGSLASRPDPLVRQLARQPGTKEQRWAQLLSRADVSVPADHAPRAAAPAPRAVAEVAPLPAELASLAPFVGSWEGAGAGEYPTIEGFAYTQEIHLLPVPGKPFLAYRSATRAADDQRPLHAESGWLRLVGDGWVELVVAQGSGVVEITEGLLDGSELSLESTTVAGSTTAKSVTATERRYRVDGDVMTYDLAMAAVGQPLVHHLRGRLTRRA